MRGGHLWEVVTYERWLLREAKKISWTFLLLSHCPRSDMEHQLVSDLPAHVKNEIAQVLDTSDLWRLVVKAMTPNIYSKAQTEEFAMATLVPGGSPTLRLLNSLGERNKTTQQLCNWISSLSAGNYPGLQRLLSLLQGPQGEQFHSWGLIRRTLLVL